MASNISNDVDACHLNSQVHCIEKLEDTQQSVQNIEDANAKMQVEDENYANSPEFTKPFVGMAFETHDEAYEYYNLYARVAGFSIRKSYFHKSSRTRKFANRLLVCSRQGHKDLSRYSGKEVKRKRDVRDGCNAHLLLSERKDGKWEVRKFIDEHSHPLSTLTKATRLYSHNILTNIAKEDIMLPDSMIGLPRVSEVINNLGESSIASEMCVNYLKAERKNNISKECMNVITCFLNKHADDDGFFFKWELDENDNARSVFWADSRARDNYITFGDVVIFRTMYRINKCCMPFAPFTGINHHRQSILFGCALLSDEDEDTFTWLFHTLLECMNRKHPTSMVTDHDISMGNAISVVFPNVRQKFCISYIWDDALSNIQDLCSHNNFMDEFQKWIYESTSIEEFEDNWHPLKQKYKIPNGHWVENMYNKRRYWVPIYLNDIFLAGMPTTQTSESMNHFFDGFMNSTTSIFDFVQQYEQALYTCREAEEHEDFKTLNSKAAFTSGNLLENHAWKVYTQEVFAMFQKEYKDFTNFLSQKILKDVCKVVYSVYRMGTTNKGRNIVEYSNHQNISIRCSCRKFEQDGIFCAHILHILYKKGVTSLPEHYILHRWTINARYSNPHEIRDNVSPSTNGHISSSQKFIWRTNIWKFLQMGLRSSDHLDVGMSTIHEAFKKFATLSTVDAYKSKNAVTPSTQTRNDYP